MAKGRKTGGRTAGTPNKITREAREVFKAMFDNLAPHAEGWIRDCAAGEVRETATPEGGTKVHVIRDPDPGKAADLVVRMAEHFVPKLSRIEKTIADASDEELLTEVRRRAATKGQAPA
jgi:hypothetical protein